MTDQGATNQALANLLLEELAEGLEQNNDILQLVLEEMRRRPAELAPVEVRSEQIDLNALALVLARAIPKPTSDPALLEAFKKMEDRIAELAASRGTYGGGGVVRLADDQEVTLSNPTLTTVTPKRESRLDYDTRTDSNPVYVGDADPGTATNTATWTILRLTYDTNNRLVRKQLINNVAWDDRAGLGW